MSKINARNKGFGYERKLVIELRKLFGQDDIGTARNLNRIQDSLKNDIVNIPMFNAQAKATESTPPYHKLLKEMPNNGNYNIIFHKRNNKGEVVVMDKLSFYALVEKLRFNGIL